MIALYAHDAYAALGLATALDIERLPYRRITHLADAADALVIAVGADLTREESLALAARRALVLHGGSAFARYALGAADATLEEDAVALPLSEPLWPRELFARAQPFGVTALELPRAPFARVVSPLGRGRQLGWLLGAPHGRETPAAVALGDCLWVAVDLGTAFAHLLTEQYAPASRRSRLPRLAQRAAESLYYRAPSALRTRLQRAAYARCAARLAALGARASRYPIDASGWLLLELITALVGRLGGGMARLARWPHGHAAAAVLTHDLEPRAYAYGEGLDRLLAHAPDARPAAAFGVVARAGQRHLRGARRAALAAREVFCHGYDHRAEPLTGARRLARRLTRARTLLERHLGRPVAGYRSPRLDRSSDLDRALDAAGFAFDSSHPDVDRENPAHYGRGVRLCLPYRVPLADAAAGWRPSRCLEVPLTAPDCIQPLFAGVTPEALAETVREKAAWVRASGGCYVALVHAGVFGPDDAARRAAHLDVVRAALAHPDTWFTTIGAVVDWWGAREQLHIEGDAWRGWRIVNEGPRPVVGATLLLDDDGATQRVALPPLPAHSTYQLAGRAGLGARS